MAKNDNLHKEKVLGRNRLTNEEFIESAKLCHVDKYDYSLTNYTSMNGKVIIICKKHGEFEQIVGNHVKKKIKAGCPYCANKKVFTGENDLATVHPKLVKYFDVEKNNITPDKVFASSNKKYWWVCDNGHSFQMSPLNRKRREKSCPYCSGTKIKSGLNDLDTLYPDIAQEFSENNEKKATEIAPCTHTKYLWLCPVCGNEYEASPNKRVLYKTGCPCCKQSGGEQAVKKILEKHQIQFRMQEWFEDCRDINPLCWDFTLYNHGKLVGAIEYNGKQHYQPIEKFKRKNMTKEETFELQKKHDTIKVQYAFEHGFELLVIPYKLDRNISQEFEQFLIKVKLIEKGSVL